MHTWDGAWVPMKGQLWGVSVCLPHCWGRVSFLFCILWAIWPLSFQVILPSMPPTSICSTEGVLESSFHGFPGLGASSGYQAWTASTLACLVISSASITLEAIIFHYTPLHGSEGMTLFTSPSVYRLYLLTSSWLCAASGFNIYICLLI